MRFRTGIAAAMLLLAAGQADGASRGKYYLADHCGNWSRWEHNVFDILDMADTIVLAHVSDNAEYEEDIWYEAEFQIKDVLLGNLKKGTTETLFAHIGRKPTRENLEAVFKRATLHGSPEFFPLYFTGFSRFGYAVPPETEECYPVPYVLKNVSYVIVLSGRTVLSAEPVLTPSDYWLQFLRSLKKASYWHNRAFFKKRSGENVE